MSNIVIRNDAPDLLALLPTMPQREQTWHCFSSPEAIVEYLRSAPRSSFWNDQMCEEDEDNFYGPGYSVAQDMLLHGWYDGARRVEAVRDKIAVTLPQKLKLAEFHVAGAKVDVPRFLSGEPKCMTRPAPRVNRARPILTLVNHMGGLAGVRAECFINRAGVVAAMVDAIESNGYSCHVIGLSQSANHGSYLCGLVATLKEPGGVLDIARLAFSLGHVAMFRRLVFAVRGSDPRNMPLTSSMGHTVDFPLLDVVNTFVLPSMNTVSALFASEEKAMNEGLAAMLETLRKQGCPAFREEGTEMLAKEQR